MGQRTGILRDFVSLVLVVRCSKQSSSVAILSSYSLRVLLACRRCKYQVHPTTTELSRFHTALDT
jgi:hypothetical protein